MLAQWHCRLRQYRGQFSIRLELWNKAFAPNAVRNHCCILILLNFTYMVFMYSSIIYSPFNNMQLFKLCNLILQKIFFNERKYNTILLISSGSPISLFAIHGERESHVITLLFTQKENVFPSSFFVIFLHIKPLYFYLTTKCTINESLGNTIK